MKKQRRGVIRRVRKVIYQALKHSNTSAYNGKRKKEKQKKKKAKAVDTSSTKRASFIRNNGNNMNGWRKISSVERTFLTTFRGS